MKKICAFLFFLLCLGWTARAQQSDVRSSQIKTLRVVKNNDASLFPVLELGSSDEVEISFDDLTHVYHRYLYRVVHCDADWKPSEGLFDSDFLDGTNNDLVIENYAQSSNTTVLYTHYSFRIPDNQLRLRLSGNYKVEIYEEDAEDKVVAEARFRVVDSRFGITAGVRTNTDVDWNQSHQQVEWKLNFGQVRVLNPDREIRTVVMQNRRTDTEVVNAAPTYVTSTGMEWRNCKSLIFNGGNEYRKFELLNLHMNTLGVERMTWFAPYYHAQLVTGAPQRNYIYQEDQNGRSYVRTEDNADNDTQSDYVIVHYSLQMPQRTDGDFYVSGDWTQGRYTEANRMVYDSMRRMYVADILQKQGYYNYQYLFVAEKGPRKGLTAPAEGDFYQTENEYTLLVYYRPQNGRYDRLLGFRDFTFHPGR